MKNNCKMRMYIKLPDELLVHCGIDEDSTLEAYIEDGCLVLNSVTDEELNECDCLDGESYDLGFVQGFDEGLFEGRDDGYLVGYRMGYTDAQFGEKFNNSFLYDEEFEDALGSETAEKKLMGEETMKEQRTDTKQFHPVHPSYYCNQSKNGGRNN